MSKPAVTVLITTFQRPHHLRIALKSTLRQSLENIEIVIMDDNSQDNTAEIVRSMKDTRIRYFKNTKNIGFPGNFRKGLKLSRGTYIFLLSDDDFILKPDTLEHIYKEMNRYRAGFGETALFFYDEDIQRPYMRVPPYLAGVRYFAPSKKNLINMRTWHFGFASGHIYRRNLIRMDDVIDDIWFSHVRPIYRLVTSAGSLFFGSEYVVGRISKSGNVAYLDTKTNKGFHMEKLLMIFAEFNHSKKDQQQFSDFILHNGGIHNFPGIKLFSSSKNTIRIARSTVRLDRKYLLYPDFWFYLIVAISVPKPIWRLIRELKVSFNIPRLRQFLGSIDYATYVSQIVSSAYEKKP